MKIPKREEMKWAPIPRDNGGFAKDEFLNEIEDLSPIVFMIQPSDSYSLRYELIDEGTASYYASFLRKEIALKQSYVSYMLLPREIF